jgi:hypothetical protein
MPASSSASFTASSFEGCRTASIFTICAIASFDSLSGGAAFLPPQFQKTASKNQPSALSSQLFSRDKSTSLPREPLVALS